MSTLDAPSQVSNRPVSSEERVVTTYARAVDYVVKNRAMVLGVLAVVVLVIAGIVGYTFYQSGQEDRAQAALGGVLSLYEQGDYRAALDGTGDQMGLLAVARAFGGTDAGNLAHYYAGDALFQLGEMDAALEQFQAFDGGNTIIGAGALAGQAAVYSNKGEYERAGELYLRAAAAYDNEVVASQYLLDAGRNFEEAGAYQRAIDAYEKVRADYPGAPFTTAIDLYIGRAQAQLQAQQAGS